MPKSQYDMALVRAKLPAGNFVRIGAVIAGAQCFEAAFSLCSLTLRVRTERHDLSGEMRYENG